MAGLRSRRPRARGAAPAEPRRRASGNRASPRTRGCTFGTPSKTRFITGVPAHAGLHPRTRTRPAGRPRRPRARGAAPVTTMKSASLEAASPRTRGCTPDQGLGTRDAAGVGASPRTRGCTHGLGAPTEPASGVPAHAGLHPRARSTRCRAGRRPRARGAAPWTAPRERRNIPASPRTRGCTHVVQGLRIGSKGVPAHAGLHHLHALHGEACYGRPRARGAAPLYARLRDPFARASPRTRGCTPSRLARRDRDAGVPAHAGLHPHSLI